MIFREERFKSKTCETGLTDFLSNDSRPPKPNAFAFNSSTTKTSCEPLSRTVDSDEQEYQALMGLKHKLITSRLTNNHEHVETFGKAARFLPSKASLVGPGSYQQASSGSPDAKSSKDVKKGFQSQRTDGDNVEIEKLNFIPSIPYAADNKQITKIIINIPNKKALIDRLSFTKRENLKMFLKSSMKRLTTSEYRALQIVTRRSNFPEIPIGNPATENSKQQSSNCFFKSSELSLPGPGQYNVESDNFKTRIPKKKFQLFGSSQRRFSEDQTSCQEKAVSQNRVPLFKFRKQKKMKTRYSTVEKENVERNTQSGPGPGAYDPVLPKKKNFKTLKTIECQEEISNHRFQPSVDEIQRSDHFSKVITSRTRNMKVFKPSFNYPRNKEDIPTIPDTQTIQFTPENFAPRSRKVEGPTNFPIIASKPEIRKKDSSLPPNKVVEIQKVIQRRPVEFEEIRPQMGFNMTSDRFPSKNVVDTRSYEIPSQMNVKSFNKLFSTVSN